MSIDVFSIHCDALDGAKLAGFKGTEGLSRPFEFDVFFTVPAGTDVKSAVGALATLTADRDDGRGPMCWHGVLAKLRLLHETAERALYRGVLVPKLWLLRQHVRNYVHTKKKIDAFLTDTLKDAGLSGADFQIDVNGGSYPQEEFVCQYRESHLDFLHRWCEREGLYYYFEHPDSPGATEKMVIVDDKARHAPLLGDGRVRYFPHAGQDTSAGDCLRELSADFDLLPAEVMISDYNYANPSAPLSGQKAVSGVGQGTIREYGYRVFTEGEAKRLAQVKAQSMACREVVLSAVGSYLGLRAGYTFEVEDGPEDLPSKYLAIEVRHAGAVSGAAPLVKRYTGLDPSETYRAEVVAIPEGTQYRSPQSTPWPRIYGFENGTVDGPGESQYAQIDDQGRYLVRFKFDASDLPDGATSTYLRMMQPHGGTTEGWHFPLRKGTEVMVSFQGGDPDRPVIAGVVPNAVTPSNVTSKNYTQNVLRTGGGSYIVMDDMEDQQYIDTVCKPGATSVHLGYRIPTKVPVPGTEQYKDGEFTLNCTYKLETDRDAGFQVKGNWWQHVGASYWLDVDGPAAIFYGGIHTLHLKGNSNEFYYCARTTTIDGKYEQHVNAGGKQIVSGGWEQQVGGGCKQIYDTLETTVGMAWNTTVGGPVSLTSGASVTVTSPKVVFNTPDVTINGAKIQMKAAGVYKGFTPLSFETYGSKNSAGVQKADYAGISISVTTQKNDMVGSSISLSGSKTDITTLKMDITAAKISNIPVDIKDHGLDIAFGAIHSFTAGLVKVG